MRNLFSPLAAAVLALAALTTAGTAHAAGKVEVLYIDPDKFSDIGIDTLDRERALRVLDQHFGKMGERLPDGQELRLEISDIDLAGAIDMGMARGSSVRAFVGGRDGPQIRFRYRLRAGTTELKTGEADLSNPKYAENRRTFYQGSAELSHERRLLDDWFSKTILTP